MDTKWTIKRILLCGTIIVIVIVIGIYVCNSLVETSKKKEFLAMLQDISTNIPNEMPNRFSVESVNSIDWNFSSSIAYNQSEDWYNWDETFDSTIYVKEYFDDWSDKDKYRFINAYTNTARNAIDDQIESKHPNWVYYKDTNALQNELYDKYVKYNADYIVTFKTEKNRYVLAEYGDDIWKAGFIKNGESILVEDKPSETTAEKVQRMKDTTTGYPFYIGMRESELRSTILGIPNSVEKCRDFDMLQSWARHKTYEWESTSEHGWYEVTVKYRKYIGRWYNDYEEFPSDNGYVAEIVWVPEKGKTMRRVSELD